MKLVLKFTAIFCFTTMILVCGANRLFAQVQAEDPTAYVQEYDMKLDKLGDATWEVSSKLNQAQWEGFKSGPLVNDPSISKRDLERSMSTYVIEDFKRDIDDMSRTVKMTFKVKAAASYKGNSQWVFNLDAKNPQVTKLSDNSYMSTSNAMIGGQLTQQIFKITFPEGASNIQQSTDSFSKAIFTYASGPGVASYFTWNNIVGFILIIGAIVVFLQASKKTAVLGPDRQIANN